MELPRLDGLLPWFEQNKRDLPWRKDRAPYHVWLSEIMLQQTRVEAVKGYYLRFLTEIPDIQTLAGFDDDRLHKLWEGLGYYSRVRNLKKAAMEICNRYEGTFPTDHALIRELPGIGDYTAGAICSICFERPTPAVDGNVLRVITRLMGSYDCIDLPQTKKDISSALAQIYPEGHCGDFTQALMELGAMVCVPGGEPHCEVCPLASICRSRAEGCWKEIPVRKEKQGRRKEIRSVMIIWCDDRLAIRKRPDHGLLAGLWELPNSGQAMDMQAAIRLAADWGCGDCRPEQELTKKHIFTHIEWDMRGFLIRCSRMPDGFLWVTEAELRERYSLPTAFRQFLEE